MVNISSYVIMALVCGGLFIYFLIPFKRSEPASASTFIDALKVSFMQITFHKKAIIALILVVSAGLGSWWSISQENVYNEIHGISTITEPLPSITWILAYACCIYLFLIIIRAITLLKGERDE